MWLGQAEAGGVGFGGLTGAEGLMAAAHVLVRDEVG